MFVFNLNVNSLPVKIKNDLIVTEKTNLIFGSYRCNFHCVFCNFRNGYIDQSDDGRFLKSRISVDEEEFEKLIKELITITPQFKFSGCEILLNSDVEKMLSIVKRNQGVVFLDTNGSNYTGLSKMIDMGLIDVLGISLKGVTKQLASVVSGASEKLSWDNVWNTINKGLVSTKCNNVIVTYVLYRGVNEENSPIMIKQKITEYLNLFEPFVNRETYWSKLIIKINNLFEAKNIPDIFPLDISMVHEVLCEIVKERKEFSGKIVFVESLEGATRSEAVRFY